ncbi:MAG: class I SAM-dependent methyltransferase [Alphaproteobacteria bacterium]
MKTPLRVRWRRRWFELLNALGIAQRGWFIPYRYKAQSPAPENAYPDAVFVAAEPTMLATLEVVAAYASDWASFRGRPTPPTPRFDQDWFPSIDAALLYGMVRSVRPALIVEVGSGHSTRFAAQAIHDEGLEAKIIAIDPAPRADIVKLSPIVSLQQMPLQSANFELFDELVSGDILFIDSSHVLMPGSDVDILFNRVLPMLADGVLIHIHDVVLPDPYPSVWEWRGYNEQNAVACLLTGGGFELLASSHYAQTRMRTDVARLFKEMPPSPEGAHATSIWLRKASSQAFMIAP